MLATINIFDVLIAILFWTCISDSLNNFMKLGTGSFNPLIRSYCISKMARNFIFAILNLIVYIILKGSFVVFLFCFPIGCAFALTFEFLMYEYQSASLNIIICYNILNFFVLIGILIYVYL